MPLIAALQAAVSADEAARQGRAAADDRADAPAQGRNDGWRCASGSGLGGNAVRRHAAREVIVWGT